MNQINNLRKKLFEQMDNLSNCTPEEMEAEIKRSKAIAETASVIVDTCKVEVELFKSLPTEAKHNATIGFFHTAETKKLQA